MAFLALKTLFLGLIEGITEFIPVSSTAHILLAGHILGMPAGIFLEALAICIQSGAILAAVWYFWDVIWSNLALIPKIIVGFLPTGIAGLLLYPLIKPFLQNHTIIALALIIGGIALILLRPVENTVDIKTVSYRQAFTIGVIQILSFIPGVSRSGATLIGGTWLGIPRALIVPFSFLLGIPTILGASLVEIRHVTGLSHSEWLLIGLGTIMAFIVAVATIKYFIKLLTTTSLSKFGWYRIALGILILLVLK